MAHSAAIELENLAADPGHFWFGGWRCVNIAIWGAAGSSKHVALIDRTNDARTAAHPTGLSTIHVITPKATPPDAATRDAFNNMHHRWSHTVACGAIVIERGGLAGLAMRSAVTAMMLLAPRNYRVKVFDSLEDAAPWVSEQHTRVTGVQLTAAELLAALLRARAADPALK